MLLLGIGNILQKDDGFGIYASTFLAKNYTFSPSLSIINGGVEGMNLFGHLEAHAEIIVLDVIDISDTPASIYAIPAQELGSRGLNSGGAHEIGILECLDMLELQGKRVPDTTILGIVPQHVTFDIALSQTLFDAFDGYIQTLLQLLAKKGFVASKKAHQTSLLEIIQEVKKL